MKLRNRCAVASKRGGTNSDRAGGRAARDEVGSNTAGALPRLLRHRMQVWRVNRGQNE